MAKQTGSKERERRSNARERRRSLAAEPFEQLDEAARTEDDAGSRRSSAVKQALATAAAGAIAAGIAGAAKALHDRDGRGSDEETAEPHADPGDEQEQPNEPRAQGDDEGQAEQSEEPPETPEPNRGGRDEPQAEAGEEDAPQAEEPEPEAEAAGGEESQEEPQSQDGDEPRADASRDGEDEERQQRGAPAGDAKAVVDEARRQLQEILGLEPETVSGFERSDGTWTVTLEVVEVRRVPDSTDVLSSYEVTLDDDRNVVSAAQTRRYRRSQVEEG
jgi:hypothetical protein